MIFTDPAATIAFNPERLLYAAIVIFTVMYVVGYWVGRQAGRLAAHQDLVRVAEKPAIPRLELAQPFVRGTPEHELHLAGKILAVPPKMSDGEMFAVTDHALFHISRARMMRATPEKETA